MKSTLLPFVMIMTLLFLLPTGCRKDDSVSQREQADEQLMRDFLSDDFFGKNNPYYHPPAVSLTSEESTIIESRTKESMTAALKDYFAKNPDLLKKIASKNVFPVWSHGMLLDELNGDLFVLPLSRINKNNIESLVFAFKDKNTGRLTFNTLSRKSISKLKI
jgi:hypothetical protein